MRSSASGQQLALTTDPRRRSLELNNLLQRAHKRRRVSTRSNGPRTATASSAPALLDDRSSTPAARARLRREPSSTLCSVLSRVESALSIWSVVMGSGGRIFSDAACGPEALMSTPRSRMSLTKRAARCGSGRP